MTGHTRVLSKSALRQGSTKRLIPLIGKSMKLFHRSYSQRQIHQMEKASPDFAITGKNAENCKAAFLETIEPDVLSLDQELALLTGVIEGQLRSDRKLMELNGTKHTDEFFAEIFIVDLKYILVRTFKETIRNYDDFQALYDRSMKLINEQSRGEWFAKVSNFSMDWYLSSPSRIGLDDLRALYAIKNSGD